MARIPEETKRLQEIISVESEVAMQLLLGAAGSIQDAVQLHFDQEKLRKIIGVSADVARNLMFAAAGSLETALQIHFEDGAGVKETHSCNRERRPANGVIETWQRDVLRSHNEFRRCHGVPDLVWSDECYRSAKIQADACQRQGEMFHATCEGPSGRHGQNIYWCSAAGTNAHNCVKLWYDEFVDYDFSNPCFGMGTGHFTQVVWKDTQSVGMAASEDGKYIVANYHPAGNVRGAFARNVLPRDSPYEVNPRRKFRRH